MKSRCTTLSVVFFAGLVYSQDLFLTMDQANSLLPTPKDLSVFASKPQDSACLVSPIKPTLDFDFTFHTGYELVMPMKDLLRAQGEMTVLFRVISKDHTDETVYMSQQVIVPPSLKHGTGQGVLKGVFSLGEGQYHVDWLIRDKQSHLCSTSWNIEAKLSSHDSAIRPLLYSASPRGTEMPFAEVPSIARVPSPALLNLAIIANFAPAMPNSVTITDDDIESLMGILRRISKDPSVGEYSLIACSLKAQKVLLKQAKASRIDLHAIGDALKSLNLGLVDAKTLGEKDGPARFFADLFAEEASNRTADALIVVGPKPDWDVKLPKGLAASVHADRPVFYLSYNPHPEENPWRDFIGKAVKKQRGIEYSITHPKDFIYAWTDIMSRLLKTRRVDGGKDLPAGARVPAKSLNPTQFD